MNTSLMRNKRGFSLIELLVIVAIIGILVGVATPYLLDYIKDSKIAKAEEDLDVLTQALILHDSQETSPFGASDFRPLVGTYLNEEPPRDPWGNTYRVDSNIGMIKCFGPDQQSSSANPDTTGTLSSVQLDDIVARYLPPLRLVAMELDITRGNLADQVDAGDLLFATFTKGLDVTLIKSAPGALAASWCDNTSVLSEIFYCYGATGNAFAVTAPYITSTLDDLFAAAAHIDNNRTVRLTLTTACSTALVVDSAFNVGDAYYMTSCDATTDVKGKPVTGTVLTPSLVASPLSDTSNFHAERPLCLTTSAANNEEAYMVPLKYR